MLKMLNCEKNVIVFLLCLLVMLFSCADESSDNALDLVTKENLSLPKLGLHGSEYRNQRYLFKLLSLPVNNWKNNNPIVYMSLLGPMES